MRRFLVTLTFLMQASVLLLAQSAGERNSPAASSNTRAPLRACGLEVVSTVRGRDIGNYAGSVLAKVRTTWNKLLADDDPNALPEATTLVELRIAPDGSTQNLRVSDSARDQALDAMARQAIASAGPFGRFPDTFRENVLDLKFHFVYNQPRSQEAPTCGQAPLSEHHQKHVLPAGGTVQPPRPRYNPDPEYSERARKLNYLGLVTVAGVVDEDGNFTDLCLKEASGEGLDEQAIKAVRSWKFDPATKGGVPVATYIAIQVAFELY